MVFERSQDKLLVDLGLSFSHGFDALVSDPQSHLVEPDELVLLGKLLDH